MRILIDRRTLLGQSVVAALVLPARARAQAISAWDQIATTGKIRFGMYPNQSPYNFTIDGKSYGFRLSMARDCAEKLGKKMGRSLEVEEVPSSLQTIVLDIQANRIDVHMGLTVTEERQKAVDMFGPIYLMPVAAFSRTGFAPLRHWEDLDKTGIKVSVLQGSTDETAARERLKNVSFRGFKNAGEVLLDVISGNADAAVMGLLLGMNGAKQNSNIGNIVPLEPLFAPPSGGAARKDGDGRLTAFLQEWATDLQASGRAAELILESMKDAGLDVGKLPPNTKF